MTKTTEGIVFRVFQFRDTSKIAKIFTKDFGLRSFIVRGSKSKSSGTIAKLQPLNLVKFSFSDHANRDLVYLRELELDYPYKTIHSRVDKSSVILFLSEVLYKTIREESENSHLYAYIKNAMLYLDQAPACANYHLVFLIKLSRFIGYLPVLGETDQIQFFDIQEGNTSLFEPSHQYYFSEENTKLLHLLSGMNFDESEQLKIARKKRFDFLCDILDYYKFHMEGMGEIKSHEVLQMVLE